MKLRGIVRFICIGAGILPMDLFSQTITGTVTDSMTGNPLKNATVASKALGKAVLTDGQGAFSINAAAIKYKHTPFNTINITLSGPVVRFAVAEKQSFVSIVLFDFTGREIGIVSEKAYPKGTHTAVIPSNTLPSGLYVLRCRIGKTGRVFMVSAGCFGIKEQRHQVIKEKYTGTIGVAETDTLLVSRYGYYPATQIISSYSGNHAVRLRPMPANAIVPPGMKFIEGDTFQMGSQKYDPMETPVHDVILSPYFIDSTEVTQLDYCLLMNTKPWESPSVESPVVQKDPYHPAGGMTWYDAAMYCNARSRRDNLDTVYTYSAITGTPGNGCVLTDVKPRYDKAGYRLPTEAEWEYAYGTGKETMFFWGETGDSATFFSWFTSNADHKSHTVAQKRPNQFGLYDMGGNICEWVNDWFFHDYSLATLKDPTGPDSDVGMGKMQRGGCWLELGKFLRTTKRFVQRASRMVGVYGFRVALPKR